VPRPPRKPKTRTVRRAVAVVAVAVAVASLVTAVAPGHRSAASPVGSPAASCPTTVKAKSFASAAQLRRLNAKIASFGLRSPGSRSHTRELAWLAREFRQIPGMTVRSDFYSISRWQPSPAAPGKTPGRDLARAGGLKIVGAAGSPSSSPVAGAVPYTVPTRNSGRSGRLVYIRNGAGITQANARGKIIVSELPPTPIPYAFFGVVAHYLTPDVPGSGNYDRPYIRPIDQILIDAGRAGAVGVVFPWEVPRAQVKSYFDPHSGTRFRVSAVYVGNEQAAMLKQRAEEGRTARIIVRAKWDRARTRNIIATLPGQSRPRIVVNTHTDGATWVQENGSAGVLALARYLGRLPKRCRHRTLQFALTSAHLGFRNDGTFRYARRLDRDYDKGTVDFVMVMEHLGTREILPSGPNNRLRYTGKGEVIAWSVGEETPVLVNAAITGVKRRKLDRTAVLKGVEAGDSSRVPEFCSQGGLGSNFQPHLIPTMSTITGPWSLWAPSFGSRAIDFKRMRREVLAMGDVARALDRVSPAKIAGSYVAERKERAAGKKTCTPFRPPAVAPGP
jgi:hypothetical protein